MVLAAIVLIVGFLALAALVARVQTLPQETSREREDPFLGAALAVQRDVERTLTGLDALVLVAPPNNVAVADFPATVEQAMAQLAVLQAAQGRAMEPVGTAFLVSCAGTGVATVEYSLTDGRTEVRFEQAVPAANGCV